MRANIKDAKGRDDNEDEDEDETDRYPALVSSVGQAQALHMSMGENTAMTATAAATMAAATRKESNASNASTGSARASAERRMSQTRMSTRERAKAFMAQQSLSMGQSDRCLENTFEVAGSCQHTGSEHAKAPSLPSAVWALVGRR